MGKDPNCSTGWGARVFLNHALPPDCLHPMERNWCVFSYVEKGSITSPTAERTLGVEGNPPIGSEQAGQGGQAQGPLESITEELRDSS